MKQFTVLLFGQLLSAIGTGMTRFGIGVWIWQTTGRASAVALYSFFAFLPRMVATPIAGALVDRWDRKVTLIVSDAVGGVGTIALALIHWAGGLEMWHICIVAVFTGLFDSFQFPALTSTTSLLVDKEHLSKASGRLSFIRSGTDIAAPVLAGVVLGIAGLGVVLVIDIVTFLIAVSSILLLTIPRPPRDELQEEEVTSIVSDSLFGLRYIASNPSFRNLGALFFITNLAAVFGYAVMQPMILARTDDNSALLATVMAALGVGGVLGGIVMSTWSGPKDRIRAVLLGIIVVSVAGQVVVGASKSPVVWVVATFVGAAVVPMIIATNQVIWMEKVPLGIQGRVLGAFMFIAQIAVPIAMLSAGPAADYVFEPAFQAGGSLADPLGGVFGTGDGSGMAAMLALAGIGGTLTALFGFLNRPLRHAESLLPDPSDDDPDPDHDPDPDPDQDPRPAPSIALGLAAAPVPE